MTAGGTRRALLRAARRVLSGEPDEAFVFAPVRRDGFPAVAGAADFYVHVPYCRKRCAHCPYNTKPLDAPEVPRFYAALREEARRAAEAGATAEGRSLYVGGGTPTCTGGELARFLRDFEGICGRPRNIAVETSPEELDEATLRGLREAGVGQLSVGVQSFSPHVLESLGRKGDAEGYAARLEAAVGAGFGNVNADLMHDTGTGALADLGEDIARAVAAGVDQITVYPLFRFFRGSGVEMPGMRARRRFCSFVREKMDEAGFQPVSVWSFRRAGAEGEAFSSVQRRQFVGLGPGAATSLEGLFAFNTFDTAAWMERAETGRCAYSLEMALSPNLRACYDLYWALYALNLPRELPEALRRRRLLDALAALARGFGFARGETLTERGARWIHWLQNLCVLDYIDHVWAHSKATAFPAGIRL
jgi:oxygen-independent coproporphyrinogen-3 oxidase